MSDSLFLIGLVLGCNRYLGHLIRSLKSKRHAEANLMARYRNLMFAGSSSVGTGPLQTLQAELNSVTPARHSEKPDCFPLRARGEQCALSPSDCEDLHAMFMEHKLYQRVFREWTRAHPDLDGSHPGQGIQSWKPWQTGHQDTKAFNNRNDISLLDALAIFHVQNYRACLSGVWHAGEQRAGCGTASEPHTKAQSVFKFVDGDAHSFGRILCMFQLSVKIPGGRQGGVYSSCGQSSSFGFCLS